MLKSSNIAQKILCFLLILTSLSCAENKIDPFDRNTGLTRSDVKNTMLKSASRNKIKKDRKTQNIAPIPAISKLIITPPPPTIGGNKIISFSVTDQISLKDVLIEFGRITNIDVDLDPTISGGIILNAKNRPLKEVIDRIASLGNLRYSYRNNVLHFERDSPYMKNYFVDYITDGSLWSDVETNITAVLDAFSGSSTSNEGLETSSSSFTSNKSAGIISVVATQKQHKAVEKYLTDVERYASAQVLIEAKVVEVKLSDKYQTGINWSWTDINKKGAETTLSFNNGYTASQPFGLTVGAGNVKKVLFGGEISASISALEKFGTTKTLSSPRIHAMNNQKATLNFADKLIYFEIENTQTQSTGQNSNTVTTSNSTKQEESVGVELSITPSINLGTNEITMTVLPKLSVKSGEVTDPVNTANKVPLIQTREINTTAKIQSGNIIVIGGLMKQDGANTDTGVPFLSKIPILGWLFKSVSKTSNVTETVLFIKATIVDSDTPAGKVDRELQEKFDLNKRRFFE